MKKNLIIHGWRDINHSFSVVNQNQILELLNDKNFDLYHFDEEKYNSEWSKEKNSNISHEINKILIQRVPHPISIDYFNSIVYSINYPFLTYKRRANEKIYNFIVTEFGISGNELKDGIKDINEFNDSNDFIITPSKWSSNKLINAGFEQKKINIIPHGIDKKIYGLIDNSERSKIRSAIGIYDDSFCFLNIGSMTYNKGIDLLIESYSIIFNKYKNIKLILKDQSNLYGINAKEVITNILNSHTKYDSKELRDSIILISDNLTLEQLNSLYNIADCYISPYRAEGFNIPVLEAMACGCPVIVSDGGSTDDFVNTNVENWYKIQTNIISNDLLPVNFRNKYNINDFHLSPIVESICSNMEAAIKSKNRNLSLSNYIIKEYSWQKVCEKLTSVFRN